jgi:predicted NAD-dependent protein-ADP-ribosyltransferase YbiA (DUF1768 family)
MATPVTAKKMEEAKQKAAQRKAEQTQSGLFSLSEGITTQDNRNFKQYRTPKKVVDEDFTSDLADDSRFYKSFEKISPSNNDQIAKNQQKRKMDQMVLQQQEVLEAPLGMGTDDYVIDPKNIVCFNGKAHFLSCLYPAALEIDGNSYPSVEHYYQACKVFSLAGPQYALILHKIKDTGAVKVKAKNVLRQLRIKDDAINQWKKTHGFVVLYHAIVYKFLQNLDIRQKLIDTNDAILAHTYNRENFYACGLDDAGFEKWAKENEGKVLKIPSEFVLDNVGYVPLFGNGKNIIGAMCMKVRKQITDLKTENKDITIGQFLPALLSSLSVMEDNGEKKNMSTPSSSSKEGSESDASFSSASEKKSNSNDK